MKTYKDIMEVMSMKDLNKIPGGSDAQRKIAQDRQRAREAKNRGFDAKTTAARQDPLAKAAPGVKAPTAPTKASAAADPLAKAAPGVKAPTAPTKASAATDPLKSAANKGGALALRSSPSSPADKGASIVRTKRGGTGKEAVGAPRKSGPGVPQGGGKIVKSSPGSLTKRPNLDDKQAGQRPGTTRKPQKKSGINYGALAKKGVGAAKSVGNAALNTAGKAARLAGKGINKAVETNKASKPLQVAKGENLKGGELRMYGDERF